MFGPSFGFQEELLGFFELVGDLFQDLLVFEAFAKVLPGDGEGLFEGRHRGEDLHQGIRVQFAGIQLSFEGLHGLFRHSAGPLCDGSSGEGVDSHDHGFELLRVELDSGHRGVYLA